VSGLVVGPTRVAPRPRAGRHRASWRRLLAPAALALALAGCGGSSSSPGIAHVGATDSSSLSGGSSGSAPESGESRAAAQQKLVKFAQCMRAHGEPEFPEPVEGNIRIQSHNGSGPNPESPQWRTAEKACSKYAPANVAPSPAQQKAHQAQALKFSECMRGHGVPGFPDPKFSSGGGVQLSLKGINPSSPQFQAAQKACQSTGPFGKHALPPVPAKGGAPSGGSSQSSEGTAVAP
jgi:hypothetical protein